MSALQSQYIISSEEEVLQTSVKKTDSKVLIPELFQLLLTFRPKGLRLTVRCQASFRLLTNGNLHCLTCKEGQTDQNTEGQEKIFFKNDYGTFSEFFKSSKGENRRLNKTKRML